MKNIFYLITISFLLIFINGCKTVQQPAPAPVATPTQKVDNTKKSVTEAKDKERGVRTNKNKQPVNQKSDKPKTVTAKPTKPAVTQYKLKVTLTDIQCIWGRDGGDNPDDYGIQQYVVYKTLGKDKKFTSRNINKFSNRIDLAGQVPNIINPLIIGDSKNQIHVEQNTQMSFRNRNMISNSLVFQVTPKELDDPNASFKIFTWLKEYSSTSILGNNDDKVLMNNTSVNVKINEVIKILSGTKTLNENTRFPDSDFDANVKFHNYGSGFMLLTNLQKIKPLVLEGPIYVVHPGLTVAAVWVQFELLD